MTAQRTHKRMLIITIWGVKVTLIRKVQMVKINKGVALAASLGVVVTSLGDLQFKRNLKEI